MTFWQLIRRNLRFYARAHLGVVLGAAIGSAALIGALVVGDSVRESLRSMALRRLGAIHFALSTQDRLFGTSLGAHLARAEPAGRIGSPPPAYASPLPSWPRSSALVLPGIAARQDGTARANRVTVLGVAPALWPQLAHWGFLSPGVVQVNLDEAKPATEADGATKVHFAGSNDVLSRWNAGETAFINLTLARQLAAREGDEIILRVRKPSALGLDAAISPRNEATLALRLRVGAIPGREMLGDFCLTAQSAPPANLFLPEQFLAAKVGVSNRANLLVAGELDVERHLSAWDRLRAQVARWLFVHAPRRPINQVGPVMGDYRSGTSSWVARAARRLEPKHVIRIPDEQALPWLNTELDRGWLPEDAGLSVRAVEQPSAVTGGEYIRPFVEITNSRIFLEPSVIAAAFTPRTSVITNRQAFKGDGPSDVAFAQFVTNGVRILTYLANLIQARDRATPYSMVTAAAAPFVPADMRDDEILVNQGLADDLGVKPGDSVALSYYVVDSGSRLAERTNSFRVRQIVPLRGIYADRTLMPEFPGLAKAESTHDWDAGFPLVYPIRPKDEAYWKTYRGTPKAFVTLAAGQAMWANRFGALTAIRYDVPTDTSASTCREAVYRNLLANLKPEQVGLRFEAVREQALKSAAQSQDFGQLFLGFSLFLVVAALLLMALLFQLGLEQRAGEVGILLALGLTPGQVRRLLLVEGAALALLGGVAGALGGLVYAKAMVWALTTVWRSAIGSADLRFHATVSSLCIGLCSSTVVATLIIWLTLRKQARQPARVLLSGEVRNPKSEVRSRGAWIAGVAGVTAVAIVAWAVLSERNADPEAFFGAGALLLIAGLGGASAWLGWLARESGVARLTLRGLGVRGCARRRKRSVATIALLACGSFVIVAIGVFRLDANRDATRRDSGTGGFALIGESSMPVVKDLDTRAGRESYGLSGDQLAGVRVVPLRVREGDVASCLNLNRAQKPRLLGVRPELLAGRFTFANVAKGLDRRQGWELLRGGGEGGHELAVAEQAPIANRQSPMANGTSQIADRTSQIAEVPAIGDANSIQWALGKEIGDTIDYTDEQGRGFKVRLVGAVANSILQGSLLIDEAEFTRRFPGESGYRMLLIDAPSNSVAQVSTTLSRALQDTGLELTPAAERLNEFNAVQNTYLGTFQILGGLGLLLGSAGLGVVVLRNVLERRGELGLLVALGFRRRLVQRLVLSEHGALLGAGIGLGIAAAAVAVLPAIMSPGTQLPYGSLAVTLAAVLLNGLLWTWLATGYALRGNLLAALRNA